MAFDQFTARLSTEDELRTLLGTPGEMVMRKELQALDAHCHKLIAHAPMVIIGTYGANGTCDVSPRGDAPGFVQILNDQTLIIPDRPGNRRFDSLRNILETGRIGLLFVIPGMEETLRLNGRACLSRDAALLERCRAFNKLPNLVIGVEVEECFLQCAKAFKRSQLWDTTTWPQRTELPTLAQMLHDHTRPKHQTVQDIEEDLQESYTNRIY